MILRIQRLLRIDGSFWWPIKVFGVLVVLLILQANPDVFVIATWVSFLAALALWAYYRNIEPFVVDFTDTQEIPVIRAIRCPKCSNEQTGVADTVVRCHQCQVRLRIPAPGKKAFLTCPTCEEYQEAEEGTWHSCITGCGFRGWVSTADEDEKLKMEEAA